MCSLPAGQIGGRGITHKMADDDLHIELTITFESGRTKELVMNGAAYRAMCEEIRSARHRHTVSVSILDANGTPGEIMIPWDKVETAEAFLSGTPSPDQVARIGFRQPLAIQPPQQ